MWGILGSGFGLYGYLPAMLAAGQPSVSLPERYRAALQRRPELQALQGRVRFVADDAALLAQVDGLVIAQRPDDLPASVEAALQHPRLRRLVLEKPLGSTPARATQLLTDVEAAGKTCRAGFTFRWTSWARRWQVARQVPQAAAAWSIRWQFRAHHYRQDLHNWKRMPAQGGGAMRFYGIHLLALLAEWGYTGALSSVVREDLGRGERAWEALLTGPSLPPFHIEIDSDSASTAFVVEARACSATDSAGVPLYAGVDPFDAAPTSNPWPATDRRCAYLQALLTETMPQGAASHRRLHATNALWSAVEAVTVRVSFRAGCDAPPAAHHILEN